MAEGSSKTGVVEGRRWHDLPDVCGGFSDDLDGAVASESLGQRTFNGRESTD